MTSGTDIGKTFNQSYGTGTSEIFDTSPMVNVARDMYGQENQWAKLAAKERTQSRNLAHKEVMSPADFWQRDAQILLPEKNQLEERWARLMTKVSNPLEPSTDPEVRKFQEDWNKFKTKVSQSVNDRNEFNKYQDDLRTKGASVFDSESKGEVEGYYGQDINTRYGKSAPSIRLKNPNENVWNFASDIIKQSKKTEFAEEDLNELVDLQMQSPEGKTQIAEYGAQAFKNYTDDMKKAAALKYGKDGQGNFNYIELGKDLLRQGFDLAANTGKPIDIYDEIVKTAKETSDLTDKRRGADGTTFLDKNTGKVEGEVKANMKRLLELKLKSNPKLKKAFVEFYKEKVQDSKTEEDAMTKALSLAVEDGYKTKDQTSSAISRLSVNINTGEKEKQTAVNDEWLNDLFYSKEKGVQQQAINALKGRNSSLGANIDNVKIIKASDSNLENDEKKAIGENTYGIEISYTADDPDENGRRTQQKKFISGTAENNGLLLDLIEGAKKAQKKDYKRVLTPNPYGVPQSNSNIKENTVTPKIGGM